MQIRVGYELVYDCPQPTPMILMLNIHHSRASDIVVAGPSDDRSGGCRSPPIATLSATGARASWRLRAALRSRSHGAGARHGPARSGRAVGASASRCRICRRRRWSSCSAAATARPTGCPTSPGDLFGHTPPGWARVQAICDFVHNHITFGYEHARPTAPRGTPTTNASASAATSPISASRSAAA